VNKARLDLAKARLEAEQEHLDTLGRGAVGGAANKREVQEQELRVKEAKLRIIELSGRAAQPAATD